MGSTPITPNPHCLAFLMNMPSKLPTSNKVPPRMPKRLIRSKISRCSLCFHAGGGPQFFPISSVGVPVSAPRSYNLMSSAWEGGFTVKRTPQPPHRSIQEPFCPHTGCERSDSQSKHFISFIAPAVDQSSRQREWDSLSIYESATNPFRHTIS